MTSYFKCSYQPHNFTWAWQSYECISLKSLKFFTKNTINTRLIQTESTLKQALPTIRRTTIASKFLDLSIWTMHAV
ncbi:hypothetical protein HanRHA438_Chr15g0698691 [Helianthus annuus]|nr:hypothetical protein HanRHA438_Chr15g0698691 [Helianthus annuus]